MAGSTGLIQYRCNAPAHQQGVVGRTADTLTVHNGKWAYCPMDVRASAHQWVATGGVAIEMLRRGTPSINLDLDVRPHSAPSTAAEPRPSAKRPSASTAKTAPPSGPRKRASR